MMAENFQGLTTGSKAWITAFQRAASRMKNNNSSKAPPPPPKQNNSENEHTRSTTTRRDILKLQKTNRTDTGGV